MQAVKTESSLSIVVSSPVYLQIGDIVRTNTQKTTFDHVKFVLRTARLEAIVSNSGPFSFSIKGSDRRLQRRTHALWTTTHAPTALWAPVGVLIFVARLTPKCS